jgi:hypothetical protein
MGEPRKTKPLGELMRGPGRVTTCPECGREHACLVQNTYHTLSKGRRRLRKCRFCGYAVTETVPPIQIDGASTVQRDEGDSQA